MREISAGIIIYRVTPKGAKFLLLYHGNGYWNFPKGKLEKEERSFGAALREVREETGIARRDLMVNDRFKIYDKYVFARMGAKVLKIVVFYLAESATSRVRVSEEHDGYAWMFYKDATNLIKHGNLRRILKKAHENIRGKSVSGSRPHTERKSGDLR